MVFAVCLGGVAVACTEPPVEPAQGTTTQGVSQDDPVCGDGVCSGFETTNSCPQDCGSRCGDNACNGDETAKSCPGDCVVPTDAPFDATILKDGGTWQLQTLAGRALDQTTGEVRAFKANYWFVQGAGLDAAPMPKTVKLDLAALAADPSAAVTVSDAIAQGIEQSVAQGYLTPELKAIVQPEDKDGAATRGGPAQTQGGCADQFVTYAKTINANTPFSYSTNPGSGFSGTISGSGAVQASGTGALTFGIRRFKLFGCIPYAVYFSNAHLYGNATIGGTSAITGTVSYAHQWDWELAKIPLFSFAFFVGPLPVYIGFNLPISAGLDLQASVSGTVAYNSASNATGAFDYTCTTGGCSGSSSFTQANPAPGSVTGGLSGRIQPSPWAQVAIRGYLYTEWFAYAQLGVRPQLEGDLWGYTGNACGDANGDGSNDNVQALTFDLDLQAFVTAAARVVGATPTQWNDLWHTARHHLLWTELTGSTALQPMLGGPATSAIGLTKPYTAKMRPCYPYSDNVNYSLSWGDGTTATATSAPQTATTLNHLWTTAGTKTATLTAINDAHGRSFNKATARSVAVATDPCPGNATWLGAPLHAVFDGANCLVSTVPSAAGGAAFMWSNAYYVARVPAPAAPCPVGAFDGANCYLGAPPPGKTGFLWSNAFYYGP